MICADPTELAGVALSDRTAALLRSTFATEPFLICLLVTVPLRMRPPSIRRFLAWAGPPSATNRAIRATTIAGDGRRRKVRM